MVSRLKVLYGLFKFSNQAERSNLQNVQMLLPFKILQLQTGRSVGIRIGTLEYLLTLERLAERSSDSRYVHHLPIQGSGFI